MSFWQESYMLWFSFVLGLNFIFRCFKLIIIYYHTQKQKEIKFKPRTKLKQQHIFLQMKAYTCQNVRIKVNQSHHN